MTFFSFYARKVVRKIVYIKIALDECLDLSVHLIVRIFASDCVAKP